MKIVDELILFFSRVSLSKFSLENSLHFVGIRVFIIGCVWNVKSQLQPNRVFWQLGLAIGTSHEFEFRDNYLARLEVLSCSATASMTLQLPCMLHTCATFDDLPVARSSCNAFLECTLLSFSSHSLTHYPYMILTYTGFLNVELQAKFAME